MTVDVGGGFLVCKRCGRRTPAGEISPTREWPKHCGQTMELAVAGAQPTTLEGDVAE